VARTQVLPQAPAVQTGTTERYRHEPPRLQPEGHTIHTSDRQVPVALRLKAPVVAVVNDLFSSEECDELIHLSRIKLQRSTIVAPLTGQTQVINARSSSGTFFMLNENPFIARLDRRIAELMNWPVENGETLQILNYQIGGEYKAHYDYFPPGDPGSLVHLSHGGQRISTLVMYLNDVQAGGEKWIATKWMRQQRYV
jgi:prolyl 4-hydroxylase